MIMLHFILKIMHKDDLSQEDKEMMPIILYIGFQAALLEGLFEGLFFAAVTANLIDSIISQF